MVINVTCNANGCSSDYSALRPQPKKQAPPALSKAMPYYAPVYNNNSSASKGSNTALPSINASYSPPGEVPNLTRVLPQTGYIDVSASTSLRGPFGGAAGAQFNRNQYSLYGAFGLTTPGKGGSVKYSPNSIDDHSTSLNLEIARLRTIAFSLPLDGNGKESSLIEVSAGISTSEGVSLMIQQNFSVHRWDDPSRYKFEQDVE